MNEDLFHLGIKALIRNQEGILLLKVNTHALKKHAGEAYWDIPGGRIHRGSTIEDTLRREVEEETGIEAVLHISPFWMGLSNIRIPIGESDVGLILAVYLCDIGVVNNIQLSEEHAEAKWFLPREAGDLLAFKYPKEFTNLIKQLELEGLPKLVRDNIPDIIRSEGRVPRFHEASNSEYPKELRRKLHEEIFEFDQEDKTEDLIDIVEIVYELGLSRGISPVELEQQRKQKVAKNGGFKKRIILDSRGL